MEDRHPTGQLERGTRVEVRSGYGSSWARGFEVADVDDDDSGEHYLVRRVSDGEVLPEPFDPDALRREGPDGAA